VKAVGYIRVSTEDQAREGVSLDNQRHRIELFCAAKEWELDHIYSDEGKTGSNLNREGVQELISDCEAHKVDVVVIYKLDRLTRKVRDLGYLIDLFEKCGVAFSSVTDNFDTTTASGKLILNILGSVAQWERDIISERTRDALAHKKDQREIYSPVPQGFDLSESGELVENGAELSVIKRIKRLRSEGFSYWKIARRLNQAGITTKRGARWYPASVRYVEQNTLYSTI
jgi:site-specific DNA recombinase